MFTVRPAMTVQRIHYYSSPDYADYEITDGNKISVNQRNIIILARVLVLMLWAV